MLSSDWRVLVRRWYIVLAGVLVTAGMMFGVTQVVGVQYESTANVLMLPPRSINEEGQITNPYLELGGLEGMADVICRALTEKTAADALAAAGLGGEYTLIRDPAAAAPIILITVKSDSEAGVLATQKYLLDQIPLQLRQVQQKSSVRSGAYITSTVITQDSAADPIKKGQIRALVVAGVGGIALTLFSAALVDGLRRSSRGGGPRASRVLARRKPQNDLPDAPPGPLLVPPPPVPQPQPVPKLEPSQLHPETRPQPRQAQPRPASLPAPHPQPQAPVRQPQTSFPKPNQTPPGVPLHVPGNGNGNGRSQQDKDGADGRGKDSAWW